METKVYSATSISLGHGKYAPVCNESAVYTHHEAAIIETDDGDYEPGWYAGGPSTGFVGGGYGYSYLQGPFETEREAFDSAIDRAHMGGWIDSKDDAEKAAKAEADQRSSDAAARRKMTPESACAALVEAGIFQATWAISKKVWGKLRTKIRVQEALRGDKCAAGCLKRDAVKNHTIQI